MAVKSRMSVNMMVTVRIETCGCRSFSPPCTILRTTPSGTKRANVSMQCESRENVSCNSLTSLMLELRPLRISMKMLSLCAKSRSPNRLMSAPKLVKCRSGPVTKMLRAMAMRRLPIDMLTKMATEMNSSFCKDSSQFALKFKTVFRTWLAVARAVSPRPPCDITVTTSHVVESSRAMEEVPTCLQFSSWSQMSASQGSNRGGSAVAASKLYVNSDMFWSASALQLPNFSRMAQAVARTIG
mmetsp:Transcript_103225/g.330955  ORF Transcript_103225/g.330955 Transcript_103225/m.330955 type:complete len:241 (+) Transcript_103225:120-842(+)